MSKRLSGWIVIALIFAFCVTIKSSNVYADPLQSANYRLDESVVGVGDLNRASSANYLAVNATGDLTVGTAASSNFQIEAGSKTSPDPVLSFSLTSGAVNFGVFTPSNATVATASFSVSNYTSYGYVVQITGSSPSNGVHTINAMTTTDDSIPGTDQFGINLVANTSPVSFGSNPNNGQFGFGSVSTNYNTPNKYRYINGETIALATKSSGMTTYTISYLINVASLTPGGKYTSNKTIIITGTY